MQRVLLELQGKNPWKEAMRKCCRINKLNVDLVSYFTPLRFRTSYLKFAAIYSRRKEDRSERWLQNELKAFYWMCVAVSCISGLLIVDFGEDQWGLLSEVFVAKSKASLEYEAKKMVEEICNKTSWQPQQDQLLRKIANNSDTAYKWNDFARRLYEESSKRFLRTGKQCRERWLNHLDPSKKHGEWSEEEDRQIALLYLQMGKRWSSIAKKLGGCRTQHMIKNRYKTLHSRQKKLYANIKEQEQLMRRFISAPEKKEQERVDNQIKTQEKSHPIEQEEQQQKQEEEQEEQEMNQFVVQQQEKSKGCPLLNPSQVVYSPWYVSIPLTPNFSPNVPFFINFSTTFSSLDSNFSNQFCCVKKGEDKIDG